MSDVRSGARLAASSLALSLACCALITAQGCGGRTELSEITPCGAPGDAPACVVPSDAVGPCDPATIVSATCDAKRHDWVCPDGAHVYRRAPPSSDVCLPFSDSPDIQSLQGALVRVPTDDGRCLWIAEQIVTSQGDTVRNVAFEVDKSAPYGSCPSASTAVDGLNSIVALEGGDPSALVQIAAPYRFAEQTGVVYRLFKPDPHAIFGVIDSGGGIGVWDPVAQKIVVHGADQITIPPNVDLANAALVYLGVYLYGCPRENGLSPGCIVAREDISGNLTYFSSGEWVADPSAASTVFHDGPWISSVVGPGYDGSFLHLYAEGFASSLSTDLAPTPEGPWQPGPTLANCILPNDPMAFCAGPVIHEEISDPTRRGELAVTYDVGTTSPQGPATPQDHWPKLVWIQAP